MPPKETLERLFSYCPDTGAFKWRIKPSRNRSAGDPVGHRDRFGYLQVKVGEHGNYGVHRLAWFLYYGSPPPPMLDHINGCRWDNRICNLRAATNAQNQQNVSRKKSNTSGFPGVTWHKSKRRWRALIRDGQKQRHLGHFHTPEEAHAAYVAAKAELHKFAPAVR